MSLFKPNHMSASEILCSFIQCPALLACVYALSPNTRGVYFFFQAWRSPAESIAPKRPDHGRSVHGEPKFTEDSVYYTQLQT